MLSIDHRPSHSSDGPPNLPPELSAQPGGVRMRSDWQTVTRQGARMRSDVQLASRLGARMRSDVQLASRLGAHMRSNWQLAVPPQALRRKLIPVSLETSPRKCSVCSRQATRSAEMVRLHVKRGDESQFLFDTTVDIPVEDLIKQVAAIYNRRLKVDRLCLEIGELAEHGIIIPPNMQGLTDEQITELKLKDEWEDKCVPSGGSVFKKDEIGRRNGHAPNDNMKKVLQNTVEEAKSMVSKKQAEANVCLTMEMVKDALDQLRGAVMIVYPMGLPPHDPIRMEFENNEDLSGTQVIYTFCDI
ncbi:UPF0769 C21orf59 homolog [Pelobates cultripes]|uniref:UPF0769 C21orf59 homolog n=1 Tax=Pelobates cultripes TaxID=61616 RepID=A0AAD1QX90_PELCU|nr:UPF0769 C21orf59 homolog [Pelobates cultripes]